MPRKVVLNCWVFQEVVLDLGMVKLSHETEALARCVALAKQISVEEAIRWALEQAVRADGIALKARRPRDTSPEAIAARIARLDEIAAAAAALPVLDPRPTQDIIDDLNAL